MWKTLITILCASGTVLAYHEPQSVLVPGLVKNRTRIGRPNRILRRFTCPDGFVRLRRNCYYFSAGTTNWQEAHYFCNDRNATLATLPKKHMDRQLRKFLAGPQMRQLERWIGARYNWQKMAWEWGITGQTVSYDGFSKLNSGNDQIYQWHCAAMNPERMFRWAARNCIEDKHYVCQVPAAKIDCSETKYRCPLRARQSGKRQRRLGGRTRKQRVESHKNGTSKLNLIDENEIVPYRQGRWRTIRRSRPMWGNGMKLGMRPPPIADSTRWAPGAKYSDRLKLVKGNGPTEPDQWVSPSKALKMSQNHLDSEPVKESSGTSIGSPRTGPRTLSAGTENELDQLSSQINSMFTGEVLLKT